MRLTELEKVNQEITRLCARRPVCAKLFIAAGLRHETGAESRALLAKPEHDAHHALRSELVTLDDRLKELRVRLECIRSRG